MMAVAEISITLQLSVIVSNERTSYPTVWSNNSNKQVAYDKYVRADLPKYQKKERERVFEGERERERTRNNIQTHSYNH